MPTTSEARVNANRLNSAKSTGPKTVEGKERSRANGLKHGLTGQGIVLAEGDQAEVDRRNEALQAELGPKSVMGAVLVQQLATLSVRMERGARQESASVASNVRNAADDFDAARLEQAETWLLEIGENPRAILRKLMKSPEGVDLLVQAWEELGLDLTRDIKNAWTAAQMVTAANLLGLRDEHARGSAIGVLSRAVWGDFEGLTDPHALGLSEDSRKAWARDQLLERINEEVARLERHFETLDFTTIEQDRAGAGDRALFDPSKQASLARRYESEARRGFFKALKEFRQVEAEAADLALASPPTTASADPVKTSAPLASSWDSRSGSPSSHQPPRGFDPVTVVSPVVRGDSSQSEMVVDRDGQPLAIGRPSPLAV